MENIGVELFKPSVFLWSCDFELFESGLRYIVDHRGPIAQLVRALA